MDIRQVFAGLHPMQGTLHHFARLYFAPMTLFNWIKFVLWYV